MSLRPTATEAKRYCDRRPFSIALAAGLLLATLVSARSETENTIDPINLAERYLTAVYEGDERALLQLTSEDLLFHDSTSAEFAGGPWRFEGRSAVLQFFRQSSESVEAHHFEVRRSFSSGGRAVLEVTYHSSGDAAPFGAPGHRISLVVPAVTVITVHDGRVVEHEDFVDYPALLRQVEQQIGAAKDKPTAPVARAAQTAPADGIAFPRPDADRVARLDRLARTYLQAIWGFDYPEMRAMLHPQALYEDYTAEYFGIAPYRFEGPDEIVGFYRTVNADSGTQEITPTIRELFVAGDNVVVLIDVVATMDGAAWNAPGKQLTGRGLTVTWLRFDGDAVRRHVDHADYDTAIRQMEAQAQSLPSPSAGDGVDDP